MRLLGGERLDGKRFLDIGSGSGFHSLAALRLGAREVVAVDIDADSVATTHAVLSRFFPQGPWRCQEKSVFELKLEEWGDFDVVYSWGVLHHTGDLDRALECAARMVLSGGLFLCAIYRRVWLDPFWRWEKRWYSKASPTAQVWARKIYVGLFWLRLLVTGRRFSDYVGNYRDKRGMDFYHDVHDWMGGWPYESRGPEELLAKMQTLGFASVRVFAYRGRWLGRSLGVVGSGCDEFVFRRG
ncbi:MAG: class I SAM-dependent methyltransferase [Thermomonas hydrothermalis]|uniref:2-polyprenyl-6-hydroxyphenyl methylase / 3-demethylubiquinone-9 3-methyltransferase n=1 Tax=Thermomonas hydrothermalis TaxID=213588 RepID=A0A1M4U7R1_9GAMM|nr:class I SAM-dependent methyltransferase [Thermomonas hydrothermalis]SHE52627.1 2-polyprenyl-6-hydroxyphenyl methylase / 3-demethylubiquinone-9 3-methyltransferase [Thermomonas hydrothermalis]